MTGPTMPDPERVARRNINGLMRMGFTRHRACLAVAVAAESAYRVLVSGDEHEARWLHEIALCANGDLSDELRRAIDAAGNRTTGGTTA